MNTNKILFLISILILLTSTFFSCEKDSPKEQACKIVKIAIPGNANDTAYINYAYDATDRIIKIDWGGGLYTGYTYETNKVTVKGYLDNALSYTEIYTLNSNGQAINSTFAQAGASVSKTTIYEFDSEGYLTGKITTQASNNSKTETYTYVYENGNLTSETLDYSYDGPTASNNSYEYFTDKPNLYEIKLPYLGKKSANMVKKTIYTIYTETNFVLTTNYYYEYSSDGKITKQVTTIGSGSITSLPKYECR